MKRIAVLFAGALALAPMTAVNAQTAINTQAIAAACSGSALACGSVVRAQIAALRAAGVTGAQLDAALGQIAATVQTAAGSAAPAALPEVAEVLREVAAEVTDPTQSAAIVAAATQVETAGPTVEIPAPVLGSPT
jgi:hypothetical protein